jgi:hypothetical protein
LAALCGAALVLGGCSGPPDVGPFADATVALRSAVAETGRATAAEIRLTKWNDAERAEKAAAELEKAWARRVAVMDAAVAYTDALKKVVESGNQGAQAVGAVADATKALAEAAGVVVPAAGAIGVATDAAKLIYANIARARAAATVEEALEATNPAIQRLSELLEADFGDVTGIVTLLAKEREAQVRTGEEWRNDHTGFRKHSLRRRKAAREEADAAETALRVERALPTSERDAKREAGLIDRINTANSELLLADRLVAGTEADEAVLRTELAADKARSAVLQRLTQAGGAALAKWATAHEGLVRAVKERRPIDREALVDAVVELRALIKKAREL